MHLGRKVPNIQLHFNEVNGRKSSPRKRESLQICSLQIYCDTKLSTANTNIEAQMFKSYGNFNKLQKCIWKKKKNPEMFPRAGR